MALPKESSILAVLLALNERDGHKLVFWYPPSPAPIFMAAPKFSEQESLIPSIAEPKSSFKILGQSPSFLADLLSPKTKICGRKFLLTVDDLTFIGHPTLLKLDGQPQGGAASGGGAVTPSAIPPSLGSTPIHSGSNSPLQLSAAPSGELFPIDSSMIHFNLVFVLQTSNKQIAHELHENVIFKWSAALKHEQLRDNYLARESEMLMGLQDKYNVSATQDSEQVKQGFSEEAFKVSSLAREMRDVFEAVHGGKCIGLRVNDWIEISLMIPKPIPHFNVPLRPYHTILLLDDPKSIIKTLPADSSPALLKLVQVANPFKSFQELQKDVDCSMAQLFRNVAHLVYWGKGKIMDHINQKNVYVVSKSSNLDIASENVAEFNKVFLDRSLPEVLSSYSSPKSLDAHLPKQESQKTSHLEMLCWLLRRGYLCQLHKYIYLLPHSTITRERMSEQRVSDRSLSRSFSKATDSELEAVELLTQGKPVGPANLFRRLYPYFNGAYYTEEIMWREGVNTSDLNSVLDTFSNELLVCVHD